MKLVEIKKLISKDSKYKDTFFSMIEKLERSIPRYDDAIMKELSKIYQDNTSLLDKKVSCRLALTIVQHNEKEGASFSYTEYTMEFDRYDADVRLDIYDFKNAKEQAINNSLKLWNERMKAIEIEENKSMEELPSDYVCRP